MCLVFTVSLRLTFVCLYGLPCVFKMVVVGDIFSVSVSGYLILHIVTTLLFCLFVSFHASTLFSLIHSSAYACLVVTILAVLVCYLLVSVTLVVSILHSVLLSSLYRACCFVSVFYLPVSHVLALVI